MPKTKYNQTTSTGQDVTYSNVYQEQYLEFKLEKAVHMLLKKIDKLEDKIREIEINCSCQ
tara:strand:- start:134 stop:313 length:180 start_codon:yes stop_codon:yes gene_type:complete